VAQVFELAERVGRRPVGNIRQLDGGGYRLRFRRHGAMRTSLVTYSTRSQAEQALWQMANDGRADFNQDRRFYALVLLATFASLRWGEAVALRRSDLDLNAPAPRVHRPLRDHRIVRVHLSLSLDLPRRDRRSDRALPAILPDDHARSCGRLI
jgi:integrase